MNAITWRRERHFTATGALPALGFQLDLRQLAGGQRAAPGTALAFQHAGDSPESPSGPAHRLGTMDSVTVHYGGTPSSTGLGSWGFDTHDGIPIIWTSRPAVWRAGLVAAKQDLNDKIDSIDTCGPSRWGTALRATGCWWPRTPCPAAGALPPGGTATNIAYYLIATA